MRPLSWCSCESPNRSLPFTHMITASGTSIPTSMTLVAISTSVSPEAKLSMTCARWRGFISAVSISTRYGASASAASSYAAATFSMSSLSMAGRTMKLFFFAAAAFLIAL